MTSPAPYYRAVRAMKSSHCIALVIVCICCILTVRVESGATWYPSNIVTLGSSVQPPNVNLWNLTIDRYLLQVLEVTSSGTLVAVSSVFRNWEPFDIQVWRPNGLTNTSSFTLIWQLELTASSLYTEEFVYMEAKLIDRCASVQTGDWIGLFSTSKSYPTGFIFDKDVSTPFRTRKWDEAAAPDLNEQVTFAYDQSNINWPVQILFAAYILPDSSAGSQSLNNNITMKCPSGLVIPSSLHTQPTTTTPLPVTGITGLLGLTGRQGSTGQEGPMGVLGVGGMPGSTGTVVGATGATGSIGPGGPMGSQPGDTGLPGANGSTGNVGIQGFTGYTGPPGDTGPPGLSGLNLKLYKDRYGNLNRNFTKYLPKNAPNTTPPPPLFWSEPVAVTAMYIWLAIASGLMIISLVLIIVTCVFHSDVKSLVT